MAPDGVISNKSPIRTYPARKPTGMLDNRNISTTESISCGCSLRSVHDSFSSMARPTKYKISQIWPLFRHEYAMPATVKKLDRGSRPPSTSARKGFITRSPSPQQQRKSPVFAGVSMQRDSYIGVSATKPAEDENEDEHCNRAFPEVDVDDDSIPMGMVVCTAKGSPCCSDPSVQCGAESSKEDHHRALEMECEIPDHVNAHEAVNSSFSSRKRFGRTSPRSDHLYAAVEREFKRLGIYKAKEAGPEYNRIIEEKGATSPDSFLHKQVKDESPQSGIFDCSEETVEIDLDSMSLHHQHRPQSCLVVDQADTLSRCHECFDHQHSLNFHFDYDNLRSACNNQQEELNVQPNEILPAAATHISPDNVIESFVSFSNVLSRSHFAGLIKRSEASLQRFTNYLIKARQRAVFRENPSHTPHKHEVTACMISSLIPKVRFESPHHFKYGLQACISKVIFDKFSTQSFGGEMELSYKMNRQFMFLRAYYVLEALNKCSGEQLMEINEEFQQFCHRKLEAIKKRVGWVSRWPSKLLQAFLLALKDVWVVHKLAFAFEKPASVFFAKPNTPLDLEHMSPLVESSSKESSAINPSLRRTSPRLSPYSKTSPKLDRPDDDGKLAGLYMGPSMESRQYSPRTNPSLELDRENSKLNADGHGTGLITKHSLISSRWKGIAQFSIFPGFVLKGEGVLHSIVYLQPKLADSHDQQLHDLYHPNHVL